MDSPRPSMRTRAKTAKAANPSPAKSAMIEASPKQRTPLGTIAASNSSKPEDPSRSVNQDSRVATLQQALQVILSTQSCSCFVLQVQAEMCQLQQSALEDTEKECEQLRQKQAQVPYGWNEQ